MVAEIIVDGIPESKIRVAKYMLKTKKTKKACCEYLGITYNTTKLDKIIKEFDEREARQKITKAQNKNKVLSDIEVNQIAKRYSEGEAVSKLADDFYVSPQKIKAAIMKSNIPIRARGKKHAPKTDHIVQDLNVKFKKGDRVFVRSENKYATVYHVRDEDYLEYLRNGYQKIVYLPNITREAKIKAGQPVGSERYGVDYEIYWVLDDGEQIKLTAVQNIIRLVETELEETGMEYYQVWCIEDKANEAKAGYFMTTRRANLFPAS